ncbi:MAG: hypothetical protein QM632_04655 [Micrococcaceae bacterium]
MKKAILTATTLATGLVVAAPSAMAADTVTVNGKAMPCSQTVGGFTPGETVGLNATQGLTFSNPVVATYVADANGNVTIDASGLANTSGGVRYLAKASDNYSFAGATEVPTVNVGGSGGSGSWLTGEKEEYLNACAADTSAQDATNNEANVVAQDNTATTTTAGIATTSTSNKGLALAGLASVTAVGAGTVVLRRKKA